MDAEPTPPLRGSPRGLLWALAALLALRSEGDVPAARRAALAQLHDWWRLELCRERGTRVCIDAPAEAPGPAVAAGAREALARHEAWRASTQVGH